MSCSFSGSLPYFYFTLFNFCVLCSVLVWQINVMLLLMMYVRLSVRSCAETNTGRSGQIPDCRQREVSKG